MNIYYKLTLAASILALFGTEPTFAQNVSGTGSKPATEFTKKKNEAVYSQLNFADTLDFIEARKGFIATLDSGIIRGATGQIIVNLHDYDFLKGTAPASVNPALWRQAKLNLNNGLYKVTNGIYQIRTFDLAVLTAIETNTGYIIVDPLTNADAAKAGLDLIRKHVGNKPVVAVIVTHSHADHYGGILGVTNIEDIKSGKVKYIVPAGFYDEVISENVLLGNAMGRRAVYQFGFSLPRSEFGQVDAGLGKVFLGRGASSIVEPNVEISKTGEKLTIDGLDLIFQLTPGTEAPSEFHFFVPKYKAFSPAENATHTLHNALPPRGAKVRDTKVWAHYLDEAIDLFGDQLEVIFPSHHWPVFGHNRGITYLEKQRDLYQYINNQTIHLANQGLNQEEIAETIQLPDELGKEWYNQGFYGTVQHNSKAVYQFYLGWWDGNPANYNKLPQVEAAKKYVEFIGGEKILIQKARESYAKGEYRWVAEVLKHAVFANPENREARELQADAFEQIAYQSESAAWRNLYLTGAKELRQSGPGNSETANRNRTNRFLSTLSPEAIFDYLAIAVNGKKAEGKEIYLRFIFPEQKKNLLVYLKNGVLHQKSNKPEVKTEFALTIPKDKFVALLSAPENAVQILSSQGVSFTGNPLKFKELASFIEPFNPNWNIVTP